MIFYRLRSDIYYAQRILVLQIKYKIIKKSGISDISLFKFFKLKNYSPNSSMAAAN